MITPEQQQQIDKLLYEKKKIEAIKLHREWTNLGLKESKDLIDQRCDELHRLDPGRFPKPSGCLIPILAAVGTGGGLFVLALHLAWQAGSPGS